MATDDIRNTRVYSGTVSFTGTVSLPAGTVTSDQFSATAANRLATTKQVHRHDLHYQQAGGTDVVTATYLWRIARGAGTVLGMDVRPETAPTGGDKQFTVDLKKASDGSGTYSSLLNAVETVDNTSTDNTKQSATLAATPTYAAGDALQVVITASGSTGSQGQGVYVTVYIDEDPS